MIILHNEINIADVYYDFLFLAQLQFNVLDNIFNTDNQENLPSYYSIKVITAYITPILMSLIFNRIMYALFKSKDIR